MQELSLLKGDVKIFVGSIIRLYEVGRLDIMKSALDKANSKKQEMDFYEYILVNCSTIKERTFSLVNITSDNINRGSTLCVFEEIEGIEQLNASLLKKYFGNNAKVFINING